MSLRVRLALGVGVLVALVIALSGVVSVVTARSELESGLDSFLEERVDQIRSILELGEFPTDNNSSNDNDDNNDGGRQPGQRQRGRLFDELLINPDAVTQVINKDGDVLFSDTLLLPVTNADVRIADGDRRVQLIRSVDVDGATYRVITASTNERTAIMVGRSQIEVDNAVSGIRRQAFLLGLLGTVLAALAAWLVAARFTRPIGRLTAAAEHVAETQDFSAPIEVERQDEVGRLAGSFNTMLGALHASRVQQDRLVRDASHELRTPLTSMRTNVDFLRRAQSLDGAERDKILADVDGEIGELTSLVGELVDLSTSTSGSDEPIVSLNLADVVKQAVTRAQRRTSGQVVLTVVTDLQVAARQSLLERAVNNLLHNAIKFGPDDGQIDVVVDGGRVAVRDRGPGIAAEDRDRVFDRFYRSTATRTEPGSGLGLAIVHEVVATHGGQVFIADPAEGPGVIVGFDLPGAAATS